MFWTRLVSRTGEVLPRKDIHAMGKIHRAIHLYLFDQNNNLLLQKRSSQTDHCAEMFSISLTGHIDAGECSSQAVHREVREELGLNPWKMRFHFLFNYRQDVTISSSYIDKQFNDIYACWYKFDLKKIKFNPDEVSELKLVSFSDFQRMIDRGELPSFYSRECTELSKFLSKTNLDFFIGKKI